MHIPDGLLDVRTSAVAAAVAGTGVAVSLRKARSQVGDRVVPLAGLVSAFVFAAQMFNFPVVSGTSGHLLGGVLAAVLVGPWMGALCVSVVLVVQAVVFADGGLSALGANVVNMAIVGAIGGYACCALVRDLLGGSRRAVLVATAIAAWAAPVAASLMFALEYSAGGSDAIPLRSALWSMAGVHALIGIGEAVITTATVAAVLRSRPDLVHAAVSASDDLPRSARRSLARFGAAAGVVVVLIIGAARLFASSDPDALQRVTAEARQAVDRSDTATASPPSPVSWAGAGGVAAAASVVGATLGTVAVVRRRRRSPSQVAAL